MGPILSSVVTAALVTGLMGLLGRMVDLPKIRGEAKQAESSASKAEAEARLLEWPALLAEAKQDAAAAKSECAACEGRRKADAERFESVLAQMRGVVETVLEGAHQMLAALRSGHALDPELIEDIDAMVDTAHNELWRLR